MHPAFWRIRARRFPVWIDAAHTHTRICIYIYTYTCAWYTWSYAWHTPDIRWLHWRAAQNPLPGRCLKRYVPWVLRLLRSLCLPPSSLPPSLLPPPPSSLPHSPPLSLSLPRSLSLSKADMLNVEMIWEDVWGGHIQALLFTQWVRTWAMFLHERSKQVIIH